MIKRFICAIFLVFILATIASAQTQIIQLNTGVVIGVINQPMTGTLEDITAAAKAEVSKKWTVRSHFYLTEIGTPSNGTTATPIKASSVPEIPKYIVFWVAPLPPSGVRTR